MVEKMSRLYFIQMTIFMRVFVFANGQALYENKFIHEMNQYYDREMQLQKQVNDLKDQIGSCRGFVEEECKRSKSGYDYTGKVNVTQYGRTCQAWNSQTPHAHGITSANGFPNPPENYCRNPDGEPAPWCYTTDPNKRVGFCNIPYCVPYQLDCLQKNDPKGKKYFGTINVTKTGDLCQRWDSQTPHTHRFNNLLADQENYCRNANENDGPWCYTTNADNQWEYCSIPHC